MVRLRSIIIGGGILDGASEETLFTERALLDEMSF
jgi:hypothetical protein